MSDLVRAHLDWCYQRNLRPGYIGRHHQALNRAERTTGPLETATTEIVREWYDSLGRLTAGTRAVELSHVSSYCKWLVREGHRDDDPTIRLVRPRLQRRLPRPISEQHLDAALCRAAPRTRAFLLFAAYAGLRACEICAIHRDDIDLVTRRLIVLEGKGGKQRIVPLHPAVLDELERLPQSGYLFPHHSGHGHLRPHSVSQAANRHLRLCGIAATEHQLRHRFGSQIYRLSHDLRLTQELLGHSSPTTTAGYAAWDSEQAAAVVEQLGGDAA